MTSSLSIEGLILKCYALKFATLKPFAGGVSAGFVETCKARTVNRLLAPRNTFN
jgi:hypothetical protein